MTFIFLNFSVNYNVHIAYNYNFTVNDDFYYNDHGTNNDPRYYNNDFYNNDCGHNDNINRETNDNSLYNNSEHHNAYDNINTRYDVHNQFCINDNHLSTANDTIDERLRIDDDGRNVNGAVDSGDGAPDAVYQLQREYEMRSAVAHDPRVCDKCACPEGRTGTCCEHVIDRCTLTPSMCDGAPGQHRACVVESIAKCSCEAGWTGRNCTEKIAPCDKHDCQYDSNCIDDLRGGFNCECDESKFRGDYCEMSERCHPDCFPCNLTTTMCGRNSSCFPALEPVDENDYECICHKGFKGKYCTEEIPCEASNPCKNGGDCFREDGKAVCECLSIWKGDRCEIFDICHDDKCTGGLCNPIGETNFTCSCFAGYTGQFCDQLIDMCHPNPCNHNASCTMSSANSFTCFCPLGTSGTRCEQNANDCVGGDDGLNPCQRRDRKAECKDEVNAFRCNCTAGWTGERCTMRLLIYNVLKHFDSYDDSLVQMLEDLLEKPELIKETLPFFLALMPAENQTAISWEHEDLFEWASFEGAEVAVRQEMVKWNAATLGNCFTFNHDSSPEKRSLRYAGEREGFRALMRVRQDEYLDWIDTASLLVFVHSSKESVFGESLRFQAKPGAETSLMIGQSTFERLGGRYGECVKDKSEVNSYYYEGDYVTDGCFRSCYQDAVLASCGCMDPRYPNKDESPVCDLSKRSCVLKVVDERGDPSLWPDCHCPLPCSNGQFNVRWSQADFTTTRDDCLLNHRSDNSSLRKCLEETDRVLISVHLPYIIQNAFKEEPKLDFNKFISMLGGLLGVLCGISFITLIEFLFLCARCFFFLVFKN